MCLLQGDLHLIIIVVVLLFGFAVCHLWLSFVFYHLSIVVCLIILGEWLFFLRFGCRYFFVLLFHCCVIVFPYSLWPMVVIPCLSFLNFPVCDFSQREKLVLCSLAADVFVFHCFVIFSLAVCGLWLFIISQFSCVWFVVKREIGFVWFGRPRIN